MQIKYATLPAVGQGSKVMSTSNLGKDMVSLLKTLTIKSTTVKSSVSITMTH